ncbi:MAG: hypothetical protein IE928_09155 [Gammaproteobacteria bacterium]|nr:hypothetical protein [Gammaproteobacteria bacterium]
MELIKRLLEAGKLDAETADSLNAEVDELESKLKAARDESASRRQKLKEVQAQLEQTSSERASILESLGIDPDGEIDVNAIAEKARGKTEADQQLEMKIKRLEKELDKAVAEKDSTLKQYRESQKQAALAKAIAKYDWIDAELVAKVLSDRIEVTEDGNYLDGVSLDDGIAQFANERPHLLKAKGQGGSGYHGAKGETMPNPFAKETRNLTEQARLLKEDPQLAQRLKSQAGG